MNIESAAPRVGDRGFSLRTILQIVPADRPHRCDDDEPLLRQGLDVRDVLHGPGRRVAGHPQHEGSLRLLQASLGGMEHDAAELLAISVDGRTAAAPSRGPGRWSTRCEEGLNPRASPWTSRGAGPRDGAGERAAVHQRPQRHHRREAAVPVRPPVPGGREQRRDEAPPDGLAMEARAAAADDNREKQFTRFLYFNLGTTRARRSWR